MNRDSVVAVAQTYLIDGLLKQDVDKVLLADDCTRTEQGFNTGASGAHIREVLLMDNLKMNEAIENDRWIVEGNMASVWYDLILTGVPFPIRVAAMFELADGLIHHIDVMVDAGPMHGDFVAELAAMAPPE